MIFSLVLLMQLLLLSSSSLVVNAAAVCPPATDYVPCSCYEWPQSSTIDIYCYNQNLSDSQVSDILDAFLTTPGVSSSVGSLDLRLNRLTRVPPQMKLFPQLKTVMLEGNFITSIESGAFNFADATNPIRYLTLGNNQLTTIAPGAFKGNGYGNGTWISLSTNSLTRFESTVFQSMLEKMAPYSGGNSWTYFEINGNPFDCSDCHLAWLIRDNRHLLPVFAYHGGSGICSNGTRFDQLNPNGFADCPLFVCPLGYDGAYADPLSCSSDYICTENVAYHYDCPDGEVFDPEAEHCDIIANVPSCQQLVPTSPESPTLPSSSTVPSSAAEAQIQLIINNGTFVFLLLFLSLFVIPQIIEIDGLLTM